MPGVEIGGITGGSFKEVWIDPVMRARQAEMYREMGLPPPTGGRYVSLGQAPTEAELEANDYSASG